MFDPYHKWLGIPPDQRPPTFHQLLGIAPDERDSEVIESAAVRQAAYVRNFNRGPYAAESTRIASEIALARDTLLDPEKRDDYESHLRPHRETRGREGKIPRTRLVVIPCVCLATVMLTFTVAFIIYKQISNYRNSISIYKAKAGPQSAPPGKPFTPLIGHKEGVKPHVNVFAMPKGKAGSEVTAPGKPPSFLIKFATPKGKAGSEVTAPGKPPSFLTKHAEEAERFHAMGMDFSRKGDSDRAIAMFSASIALDNMHIKSYVQRSVALLQKRDLDKALADCAEAIRRDPRSGEAYFQRGEVLMHKGDYNNVLVNFTKAILLNEKPKYRESRGWLYFVTGRRRESMADFNRAIEMDPKQASFYFRRGFVHAQQGDLDRSLADYNESIRLDPRLSEALYWRSRLYQKMGKADLSAADRRKALEIDPGLVGQDRQYRD